jgi:hypothetical protein
MNIQQFEDRVAEELDIHLPVVLFPHKVALAKVQNLPLREMTAGISQQDISLILATAIDLAK